MRFIYSISVALYGFVLQIASLFNPKAKLWVDGRKNWQGKLKEFISENKKPIIWIHAASLGEFEQGRPIIEKIKKQHPNYAIVLTFFSPSGYEIRKNYELADYVCYLPLDTYSNAHEFVKTLSPEKVLFVKYEFWFNYLRSINDMKIPLYLVSGIFRKEQVFFKSYGGFFRKGLKYFTHLFVQEEASAKLLESIQITEVTVSGDSRFDRVMDIKDKAKRIVDIEQYSANRKVVIIGSSWEKEEQFLLKFISNDSLMENMVFIIAPHNIESDRMDNFIKRCPLSTCLYSKVQGKIPTNCRVLFIDSIGLLSSIYAYSDIAIIGGGFGVGIHNVLEAAVWGQPVLFGPNYHKFNEAIGLLKAEGGTTFVDQNSFDSQLNELLTNDFKRTAMAQQAERFCKEGSGTVEVVMERLFMKG